MSGLFVFHWLLGPLRRSSVCLLCYRLRRLDLDYFAWLILYCIADIARKNDKSGILTKMLEEHGMSIAEGSTHLVKIIEESTREKDGGEFVNFDGNRMGW
jgi:hypothetical protein